MGRAILLVLVVTGGTLTGKVGSHRLVARSPSNRTTRRARRCRNASTRVLTEQRRRLHSGRARQDGGKGGPPGLRMLPAKRGQYKPAARVVAGMCET